MWTTTLPAGLQTPVAFRTSVIAVSDDGTLQLRKAANGELEWSATVTAGIGQAPAVSRRRIFVPTKRGVVAVS